MNRAVGAVLATSVILATGAVRADDRDDDGIDDDLYLLRHPATKWWLSGQMNVVTQSQPGFRSPYRGDHSWRQSDHVATSFVTTVYGAYEILPMTSVMITGESAGGGGLSDALGAAGFSNLDVVRNPTLGAAPYIGRAIIDQVIPLTDKRITVVHMPVGVLRKMPARRIEIRAGKMSTVDIFDTNDIGTDSHRQFLNWSVDNNGSYDYAADTRGYTLGAAVEYAEKLWALRFGEFLMPTIANGIDYDWEISKARGENLELEMHECLAGHEGVVRLLGWMNHAKMGNYADANAEIRAGMADPARTDWITDSREKGRIKYGVGINMQQDVTDTIRVLGRLGWADGKNESFAYTEIDNTVEVGFDVGAGPFGRSHDRFGFAAVTNGLSEGHRTYLALGGSGFLLGDGKLNYSRENILETYYTAQAYRGVFPSVDVQLIDNPGYNKDRGPILVASARLHLEI